MDALTSSQRQHLRSLAHHLDPVCYVGKNGLTDALVQSVDMALDAHELIKVKFVECKKEKREIATQIGERTRSHIVGVIGNVVILYRQHPDPEKRRIALPES
jgi:RNA-binding protein